MHDALKYEELYFFPGASWLTQFFFPQIYFNMLDDFNYLTYSRLYGR